MTARYGESYIVRQLRRRSVAVRRSIRVHCARCVSLRFYHNPDSIRKRGIRLGALFLPLRAFLFRRVSLVAYFHR